MNKRLVDFIENKKVVSEGKGIPWFGWVSGQKYKEGILNVINNEGEYAFRDKNNVYYKPLNKNQLYALLNPKRRVSIVDSLENVNNKLNLGGISYSAIMSDLKLAYISAIADSLNFAPSESTPIEDMPTGFQGFELFDIQMKHFPI